MAANRPLPAAEVKGWIPMDFAQAQKRAAELTEQLNYHSDRYYNLDSPEISDYEYDQLMNELKALEQEFPALVTPASPTQHVGGRAMLTLFDKVTHTVQMAACRMCSIKTSCEPSIHAAGKSFPSPNMWSSQKSMVFLFLWNTVTVCWCAAPPEGTALLEKTLPPIF